MLKLTYLSRISSHFDEICHSDAVRHSRRVRPLKIQNFENPRWRRPPSWKIDKLRYLGRSLGRFRRNLAWWCSSTLLTVPTVKNLKFRKSKMAAAAILKNRNISAAVRAISTKFGTVMHFDPLERSDPYKSEISKIQDGVAAILKNRKITISWPQFKRFWRNLAGWHSSTF